MSGLQITVEPNDVSHPDIAAEEQHLNAFEKGLEQGYARFTNQTIKTLK